MTVKALKKNNMERKSTNGGFKMKGSPMQRNFGIGVSPMRKVTWWEKAKAAAKGLKEGVSTALSASATENPGRSTRYGIRAGKKAREEALKKYDKD